MLASLVASSLLILGVVKDFPHAPHAAWVSSVIMSEHQQTAGAYVVDAFESQGLAALESDEGVRILVPRAWLPAGAREGHVLRITPSGSAAGRTLTIEVDEAATEERRTAMRDRRDRLPKGPEGDLDL